MAMNDEVPEHKFELKRGCKDDVQQTVTLSRKLDTCRGQDESITVSTFCVPMVINKQGRINRVILFTRK